MAQERPLLEEVLDYAVFAPLGLALTIVEDLPALVTRGRKQVEGQLGIARFVGKVALKQIRGRFDALLETPEPVRVEPVEPSTTPTLRTEKPTTVVASDALAIEGYDSLAASQVVARLASLDPAALEAIRVYESGTRRRQTILNRIAQLEGHARA